MASQAKGAGAPPHLESVRFCASAEAQATPGARPGSARFRRGAIGHRIGAMVVLERFIGGLHHARERGEAVSAAGGVWRHLRRVEPHGGLS
jgi:hypothetical protein